MINVPNSDPKVVSFVQKSNGNDGMIAAQQVAVFSRKQVEAQSALDNAHYRLAKATQSLKSAEIEYFTSVEKALGNRENLKWAYNNALAGFRDADALVVKCATDLAIADEALNSVRGIAKAGIASAAELKAACASAKTDEEKVACVAAAKKLKLPFFLPKGWAAEYASGDESEVAKAISDGDSLKEAVKAAKTAEDRKACVEAAEKMKMMFFLPKGWKAEAEGKTEAKDEESVEKATVMVLCPHCMGGFSGDTEECENCDSNGMAPVGVLNRYFADVHGSPDDDNCSTCGSNCPVCIGNCRDCPMCRGGSMMKSANPFSTGSLLTRDFEKSAGFQNYIFTKYGVAGRSGDVSGHEFHGNQHTGGKWSGSVDARSGTYKPSSGPNDTNEGWKETVKRYDSALKGHISAAETAKAKGDIATSQGRHAEAAGHYKEAYGKYIAAHGGQRANQAAHETHGALNSEGWAGGEAPPAGVGAYDRGARWGASQEERDMYRENARGLLANANEMKAKAGEAEARAAA
jgi:hypothetical protein